MALIAGSLLLEKRFFPSHTVRPQTEADLLGNRLDKFAAAVGHSQTNLVLFMSTECHFCQQSVPFYKRLSETLRQRPTIGFLVLSPEPPEKVKPFLSQWQIAASHIYQIPLPNPVGLRGTPTLAITDSQGVIKRAFIGKLDPSRESDVFKALHIDNL